MTCNSHPTPDNIYRLFGIVLYENPNQPMSLREKFPYSEFFWSTFPRVWTEYRDLLCKSPYSVQTPENTDQKITE